MTIPFVGGVQPPPYSYIAYIDEAGDPGIAKVKPLDHDGSSEWLIIGAVLIRAEDEANVLPWVKEIMRDIRTQRRSLHFAHLSPRKRARVCELLVGRSVRLFATISNKKNMRGYQNLIAATASDKWQPGFQYFSNWLTRILFERLSFYIHRDSMRRFGEPRFAKVEISARGGLSPDHLDAYFKLLKMQTPDKLFLPGRIEWSVLHQGLFEVHQNHERAGLQLADTVASSFYQACDCIDTGPCDPQYAIALKDRMARSPDPLTGRVWGCGVKLMPGLAKAKLTREQEAIFRYYMRVGEW